MRKLLVFLSLAWTIIVYMVFVSIQNNHEEKIRSSLHSQLKQDLVVSNFELVTRSINDLTEGGVISCSKVYISKERLILVLDHSYKDNCNRSFFRLAKPKKFTLASTGRTEFLFQMIIESPVGLELSMWSVLILGLMLVFLTQKIFVFNFSTREKLMALEKNHAEELHKISKQVAHDIRSPLMALKTIAFIIPFPSEESKNLFNQGLKRINDIADDLLKRGQEKKTDVATAADKNLKNIAQKAIEEKQLSLKDKNVTFKLLGDTGAAQSKMSEIELSRVLSNLINNAYDAVEQNGEVSIEIEHSDSWQKISVIDNGRGFSEQAKIKSASSETSSGSGLGLKHAREIVEKFGGKLDIVSSEKGSKVSLLLPLKVTAKN